MSVVKWIHCVDEKMQGNFYSSYITICIGKFNNLHWKQSKFLLVLQHEALAMWSGRVFFPVLKCTDPDHLPSIEAS